MKKFIFIHITLSDKFPRFITQKTGLIIIQLCRFEKHLSPYTALFLIGSPDS